MIEKECSYTQGGTSFKGFYASADQSKRPCVLVVHAWGGRKDFENNKVRELAKLGYAAFAVDMYGEGKTGDGQEECSGLMNPLVEDRDLLKSRMLAAYEFVKTLEGVDFERIAAIGYCFGGMCVLDLARSGIDVKAVVSFHGLLAAPQKTSSISSKVMVLHGYDDPMATPEQLLEFGAEMTTAQADWQVHAYGDTLHAFTNPLANDKSFGTVYSEIADQRSWKAMQQLFDEVF